MHCMQHKVSLLKQHFKMTCCWSKVSGKPINVFYTIWDFKNGLHGPFCHLRPVFNNVHAEIVRWWIVDIALLPSAMRRVTVSRVSVALRGGAQRKECGWACESGDAKLALFSNFHPLPLEAATCQWQRRFSRAAQSRYICISPTLPLLFTTVIVWPGWGPYLAPD